MKRLSQKIDQAIKDEDKNLSVHLFAMSVAEVLIDSYGTHNIEGFNMTLKAMINIHEEDNKLNK
tara:strand:+ start:174 stop:365 length:192 start_codon:yes stop_codon:yes gene_type:complete